jgi:hypothetical protein
MPRQCASLFVGQPQHRALAEERLHRRDAELGRLLDQRVHALVGRHADRERHRARELAFDRDMRVDPDLDVVAAHPQHLRSPFAAAAVKERQRTAGLQPQHLHVARRIGRQVERFTDGERPLDVDPWRRSGAHRRRG